MDPAQRPPAAPLGEELARIGVPIALRDDSRIRIRRLRRSDSGLLLEGFRRLTPESRYRRFLAPTPELSEKTIRYLLDIDHRDHEALIALDEPLGGAVGIARYVRDRARPDAAEVAVTVVDDWQGRGLGTLLLEGITVRAREEGVDTFTALMLVESRQMMDLLERLGAVRVVGRAAGTVEVEVHLPAIGVSPELRKLIRLAAASDIAIPIAELPR
jgi:GNAT superfamily N-acetyltransferase